MKRVFILTLACIILSSTVASSQTRRRRPTPKRSTQASRAAAEKSAAELQAGRERVAAQIKTLSQFLYLYGGVARGIESADQAARTGDASSASIDQNERTKVRVKESIRNVRDGLNKLETDFRSNPALATHYLRISGVASFGEMAERQSAANRFDEAGRSLLKAVNQLADALTAMR